LVHQHDPVWILGNASTTFLEPFSRALKAAKIGKTCKVGWQADRRFGSSTNQITAAFLHQSQHHQMWYRRTATSSKRKAFLRALQLLRTAEYLGDQELPNG